MLRTLKLKTLHRDIKTGFNSVIHTRILESLTGCRTMFLFAVFCKMGALERNAY